MSADPAAEAAFEKWLRDHPPGTANVHRAFVAGYAAGQRDYMKIGDPDPREDEDRAP
ncbi:MAG TPA: hypothetical protein VFY93_10380 [Planctomycetota bacterium]|nr:hypothetical protein [Planctomycetota bacterium]